MVPVARRNLLSEKGRLVISVGGVAFAVMLVLVVVSLYRGWGDVGRLYTELPGDVWVSQTGTTDPYARRVTDAFLAAVGVLVAIGFLVGGAVIGLTAYTATVERAREFAVLKAIGASGPFLYRVVIRQSLIVGALGALLGTAAAASATLIERREPEFVTELRWSDASAVFLAALLVAVAASYVPIPRLNSIDPAVVFRA